MEIPFTFYWCILYFQICCAIWIFQYSGKRAKVHAKWMEKEGESPSKLYQSPTAKFSNPFVNETTAMTYYERLKLALFGVSLAPVRIICFAVLLGLTSLVSKISIIGLTREQLSEPLDGWRHAVQMPVMLLSRAMLFIFGFYSIRVKGTLAATNEAPIIVCNHNGMIDAFYFASVAMPAAVAAYENLDIPLLGPILSAFQAITVNRTDPNSKKQVLMDIKRRAREATEFQRRVLIFPEGTTTNGTTVISFKQGAFVAGTPVQPVAIRYPHINFNPAWVFGPSQAMTVVRLCCQFVNFMEVTYLPVYVPSEEEIADPHLYANNVRNKIADVLGVPATAHTFDDLRLVSAAYALHEPLSQASLGMEEVQRVFNVDFKTVEKHLVTFAALDTEKTGRVSYAQFLKGFELEDSPQLQKMWSLVDNEGLGTLNFKEYFYGLAMVNESGDIKDAIKLAFNTFGTIGDSGEAFMSMAEMEALLRFAMPDIAQGTIKAIFDQADKNKDGKLNFTEFIRMAEQNPDFITVMKGWFESVSQRNATEYAESKKKKKPKEEADKKKE